MPLSDADGSEGNGDASTALTFYPVYLHKLHPFKPDYVKLPISLAHQLRVPPGFETSHPSIKKSEAAPNGQLATAFPLYHHLNHPIYYVSICGIVVEKDIAGRVSPAAWKLVMDDSSGALIEVLVKRVVDPLIAKFQGPGVSSKATDVSLAQFGQAIARPIPDWQCCGWLSERILDIRTFGIGSVLKLSGRLSPHWLGKQLLLDDFSVLHGTSPEVKFWNGMARDFELVLRRPWCLDQTQIRDEEIRRADRKLKREQQTRKLAREARRKTRKQFEPERKGAGLTASRILTKELATSYQPVREESESITEGPADDRREFTETTVSCKDMGIDIEQDAMEAAPTTPLRLSESSAKSPEGPKEIPKSNSREAIGATGRRASLIDMGSPSAWESIDLREGRESLKTVTGGHWLEIRDQAVRKQRMYQGDSRRKCVAQSIKSVQEEWDALEL